MTMKRILEDQIIGKIDNQHKKQTKEVHKSKPKPCKPKAKPCKPKAKPCKPKAKPQVVRY